MGIHYLLRSIVSIRASVPADAFTASALGTVREGSGVVIRETGLVLTIGYLITEAEEIWLTTSEGRVMPGHALACDQETGFGLVQCLGKLALPALPLGDTAKAMRGDAVMVADGAGQFIAAKIVAKQEFARYWEYLVEAGIFTAPAHPSWGGAAVISAQGKLLGIGSLRLEMSESGGQTDVNMVVPISLLPPILDDLLTRGGTATLPRPWLGVFSAENDGRVAVVSVADGGPAAQAGLRERDIIAEVRDGEVGGLAAAGPTEREAVTAAARELGIKNGVLLSTFAAVFG